MSGCLLDTNVVSEIVRVSPDPQVRSFLLEQSELWLSIIALHELEFGLNLLPQGRRREALRTALPTCLETYADRILPVARAEAEQADGAESTGAARWPCLAPGRCVDCRYFHRSQSHIGDAKCQRLYCTGKAIASKSGGQNIPRRAPTRGAPTNFQSFTAEKPISKRAVFGCLFGVGLESGSVAGLGPIGCNRPGCAGR